MHAITEVDYVQEKLVDPKNLPALVSKLREEGKTIGTLNGSFDLLHAGHLYMISEAAKPVDVLIVALNSDASIKKYKSESRPIIPLEYRMQMLAALGFVSYVTFFEETDPCDLLNTICPDVHTNGAEYGRECIEADTVLNNGGSLNIVELIPGLSTTEIIKKIQSLCD